ncbi:hypothetical protein [Methylobacterium sp. J-076]|uniref:hypothetical protein n=1 Tax=Methylobacterium sp. J-076 TaxID=2836655 RepID=UPI001FBA6D03|nr:hypothetical protein [Methylobacterium sp. J-076]MCJ2012201.1 hypothetical protein [Methylobacterium sp. J-076]
MRLVPTLVASVIALCPACGFAWATPCAEQIDTIQRRLDSAGAVQVTGLQPGHPVRLGSPRGLAAAPSGVPSDAAMIPTSDHIAEARGLIRRAVNEDHRGDQRACENTMTDAKGMIGALP